MPDVRIFVSFEFDKDNDLKSNFFEQAKQHSPHRVVNSSVYEAYPDQKWKDRARSAISECDIVIVLVGPDTHNAQGVKVEVDMARGLSKPVFQVVPQDCPYKGVLYLPDPIRWRWKRINNKIDELCTPKRRG